MTRYHRFVSMADDARRLSDEQGLSHQREQEQFRAESLRNYRAVEKFIGPLAKEFASQAKRLNHPPQWGLDGRGEVPHWQVPIWSGPDGASADYSQPKVVSVCIGKRGKWWFHRYYREESFARGPPPTAAAVRQRMVEYLAQVVR